MRDSPTELGFARCRPPVPIKSSFKPILFNENHSLEQKSTNLHHKATFSTLNHFLSIKNNHRPTAPFATATTIPTPKPPNHPPHPRSKEKGRAFFSHLKTSTPPPPPDPVQNKICSYYPPPPVSMESIPPPSAMMSVGNTKPSDRNLALSLRSDLDKNPPDPVLNSSVITPKAQSEGIFPTILLLQGWLDNKPVEILGVKQQEGGMFSGVLPYCYFTATYFEKVFEVGGMLSVGLRIFNIENMEFGVCFPATKGIVGIVCSP